MAAIKGLGRNIPYLRQQFAALLGNTSTSVKFICVVVLFSYCLSFMEQAVLTLSVTPGYLLPPAFWIWTAFTFCFLEIHFWEVCVDVVTVGLCGKLIEPLWGAMEMMTFFAVVNFGVALLSTLFYLFLYMCTSNPELLFDIHIHGLTGYIAGMFSTFSHFYSSKDPSESTRVRHGLRYLFFQYFAIPVSLDKHQTSCNCDGNKVSFFLFLPAFDQRA